MYKMSCQKLSFCKIKFFMISRLEIILSIVSYERKKIISYEKEFKFTKNNTFNNVFYNRI